jgi:hypothetical protein
MLRDSPVAAVALSDGSLTVVDPFSREVLRPLPQSTATVTSLEVNAETGDVVAAYASRRVCEFVADVERGERKGKSKKEDNLGSVLSDWSCHNLMPRWFQMDEYPITRYAFSAALA